MKKGCKAMSKPKKTENSKAYFKLISDAEFKRILNKNKSLFLLKEVESKPVPLIGTVNCNM